MDKENNPKILRDLTSNKSSTPLDLSSPALENSHEIKARKHLLPTIKKNSAPNLKDISSSTTDDPDIKVHFQKEKPQKPQRYNLREALKIAASGLAIVFLINIINITYIGINTKNSVTTTALNGFNDLLEAGKHTSQLDLAAAEEFLSSAQNDFQSAAEKIKYLNQVLVVSKNEAQTATSLVKVGDLLTSAGQSALQSLENIDTIFTNFTSGTASITDDLKTRFTHIQAAHANLIEAEKLISAIDIDTIPDDYHENFISAHERLKSLNNKISHVSEIFPLFLELLGDKHPHRYLLLLQNNSETRPTGGFIGSFIILDINDGLISKLEFKDVYDADGQLHDPIEAPEEIAILTDNWRLRDSNYSPDFKVSAQKAAWFLEQEKGPSVDSVVAINKTILKDLLEITGPISVDGLPGEITSENYHIILPYLVESKWTGDDSPKDVLKDFIPEVKQRLLTPESLPKLINVLVKKMRHKEMLFYSKDSEIQEFFERNTIAGRITQVKDGEDYLSVNAINIGGNKSDRFIKQKIFHTTYLQEDGSIINEVTISREHTFSQENEQEILNIIQSFGFESISSGLLDILGKGENKVALKAYVPRGSEIIETTGISQDEVLKRYNEELDKDYFYLFMNVKPYEIKQVTIKYRLPFKQQWWPSGQYRLFMQKQPGFISPVDVEKRIQPNTPLIRHELHPEGWDDNNGTVTFKTNLLYDRLFGGIWGSY